MKIYPKTSAWLLVTMTNLISLSITCRRFRKNKTQKRLFFVKGLTAATHFLTKSKI